MILGLRANDKKRLEVGKVYHNRTITDFEGLKHHNVSFFVLRKATYEEWKAQKPKDSGGDKSRDEFFEISID